MPNTAVAPRYRTGPSKGPNQEEKQIQFEAQEKLRGNEKRLQNATRFEIARVREKEAQADTAELDYQVKRGKLLPADEVELMVTEILIATRNKILGIPVYIAPLLVAKEDISEIRLILIRAIDQALIDLSRIKPENLRNEIRARNRKLKEYQNLEEAEAEGSSS